jgi:hypothetical protein
VIVVDVALWREVILVWAEGRVVGGGTVTVVVVVVSVNSVVVNVTEVVGETQAGRMNVVVMPLVTVTTVYCAATRGRIRRGKTRRYMILATCSLRALGLLITITNKRSEMIYTKLCPEEMR